MSTAKRPSARASSSTRDRRARLAAAALWLAVAPIAAYAADRDPLRAAERALAAERDLYLVVMAEPPALEIKARGLTLDRLPLSGVAVVVRRDAGSPPPEPLALPVVWRVAETAAAEPPRRLVAPAELKPAPAEETEEAAATTAEAEPLPEPPADYRIGFDGGWELWVGPAPPRGGVIARFASAVAAGWRALRDAGPEPPGAVALAADAATARRIHHLFRAGTPVLVAPPAGASSD